MAVTQRSSLIGLFKPAARSDPYALYRRLREAEPVYWDNALQSWVVLRHADIVALTKEERLSEDRVTPFFDQLPADKQKSMRPLVAALSDMMLFNDPPRHTRLRGQFRKAFTPRFVARLDGDIAERVATLLDAVAEKPVFDLVADVSAPLSSGVIAGMLGLPAHATNLLAGWTSLLHEFFMQSEREVDRVVRLRAVFDTEIEGRRACPAHDLLGAMAEAMATGATLTEDEMYAAFLLLIDAGQVTTTHFAANAVRALMLHREQWELLRARPELVPGAVLELLRWDSSIQFTNRVATIDLEVGGRTIPAGSSVTLVLGSGNRDPEVFADPDTLDVTRDAREQLSLGHGAHYCLGGGLARREIEILLLGLLTRFPESTLVDTNFTWEDSINFRFLTGLPVSPGPGSRISAATPT
ncbi:cytochrome P450 [Nocardia sp. NPDC049190]|uniref:cytochrome P450 n=1 Tax=Nocardia sp. NPDC049190 TaxID=3155650 RepID=UPI0033EEF89A